MSDIDLIGGNTGTAVNSGKGRKWIYPKLIKGKLYYYRNIVGYALLILLFIGPFIKINGEQLILLNILERKFVFFGLVFMPQDFYLFALAILSLLIFIILFTVIFGRIWCGWTCPQTIFMEMVFRKIEYWIEGNAQQQKKLDASPLTAEKVFKRGAKHFIFILISIGISNIFLAYVIGTDAVLKIISEPVSQHVIGFIAMFIFTALFYLVFARVREMVCIYICPYGRLQGVLLDRKTLVVAYDYLRGEPRGHINKTEVSAKGDCVDCDLCVEVCPTGVDIRKGTQLECINCTLCIDACDMVMEKTNRPKRLIGFKSEEQISERKPFKFSKRIYGYAAILLILLSTLTILSLKRTDIDTMVLRASGTLYQLREDGTVSNLYNAELINRTSKDINFEMSSSDSQTKIQYINKADRIEKGKNIKLTFFIIRRQDQIKKYKSGITLNILSNGKIVSKANTTFIAPPNL